MQEITEEHGYFINRVLLQNSQKVPCSPLGYGRKEDFANLNALAYV